MSYIGLNRVEEVTYSGKVDYSGETSGHGEAQVDKYDEARDAQGNRILDQHGSVLYKHTGTTWETTQCRNVPYQGTVPYNGIEEVEITINVDDDPFNHKVSQTASSVHMVSGTVGLFQAEQIQQVSANAIEISKSLKKGFNSVVASEISQQIGVVEERSKNSFQLLQSLRTKMENILHTMERDYNTIKSRNVKQFNEINKQYTDMIHALDASIFAMSKELEASMQSYAELAVAMQALLPEESSRTRNNLEGSRLNRTSEEIIGDISNLLRQNNAYNAFIQNKVSTVPVEKEESQCLPVLFMETDDLKKNSETSTCFMHIEDFDVRNSIENAVKSALHSQTASVDNDYQERLQKKMESSNLNERELSVIRNLMDDNGI